MAQVSRETLTRNIAENLKSELDRLGDGKPWQGAQALVDLLGVAQTVFAIEAVEPGEGKEAQSLRAAATRFERLLHRRRERAIRENPLLTAQARARFDAELEVARRYTHALGPEARVALAVRDAFDDANRQSPSPDKIPTSVGEDSPLVALSYAALYYTPVRAKSLHSLRNALEKWPVLRRHD
jgi:hypothetical protein